MKYNKFLFICLAAAGLFGCELVFPFPALNPQVEDVVDGGLSKRDSTPVDSDAICFQGYETLGDSCVDIDECERGLDNCSENAICTNLDGSFECACKDGYEGEGRVCKKPPYCAGNPCQNGGECTEGEDEVICSCAPGFSGALCETNEDDCTPNPCQNNGTCTDRVASFACTCTAFWEGDTCETNVDECTQGTDNCHKTLASCTNIDEGFECGCLPGYAGDGVDCVFGRFPATADAYPLSTSSAGRAVTTGDFDKNGNLDLAIVHDDGYVRVLLGEGDGTFGAATPFLAGDHPNDVIAVDLNGDASLDLVTANWGSNGGSMASDVSVLLGVGDGTFDAAQKFAAGNTPFR